MFCVLLQRHRAAQLVSRTNRKGFQKKGEISKAYFASFIKLCYLVI